MLTIRPTKKDDYSLFERLLTDNKITMWLESFFRMTEFNSMFFAFMLNRKDQNCFTIINNEIAIGIAGFVNIDSFNKTAEIWIVIDEKMRGKGLATKSLQKLLSVGFKNNGYNSIYAWAAAPNSASINLLTRCGFKRLGVRRKCHLINDVLADRIEFDILAAEFIKADAREDL